MSEHPEPKTLALKSVVRHGRAEHSVLLMVMALALGIAGGVIWHEPIARVLNFRSARPNARSGEVQSSTPAQLWTCGMHPQVIQDHAGTCPICGMQLTPMNASAGDSASAGGVTIDPVIVQNMGVRVAEVRRQPLHVSIRAAGFLREADPNVHEVNLRVSGWIEKLYADTLGMTVARGQRLFDLYSPDLQAAIGELIAARRAAGKGGGVAAATAPGAKPSATGPSGGGMGDALLRAVRRKLQLFGLSDDQIDAFAQANEPPLTVTFRSQADGIVVEKPIVEGAAVKAGDMALRIVDYSTLWLDAQIFPQHVPHVREGQKVRAVIESAAGGPEGNGMHGALREVDGEVIFISPQIDPTTRAAVVRMQVANGDLSLRPGMWATARLERVVESNAVVVPREAIIDTGERQIAFIALEGGRFEPRALTLGASSDDGQVQVVSGLNAGEKVVVSGQFLIDSESRLREAIRKHQQGDRLRQVVPPATSQSDAYSGRPVVPVQTPADAAAHWTPEVDATMRAYLAIAEAFGAPQPPTQAIDASELVKSAHGLHGEASSEIRPLVDSLAVAVDDFAAAPLDGQREKFKPLSDAMIALMQRVPPSTAVTEKLVIVHCPMAPGNWLQKGTRIANPYYATEMKQCGEITGYIESTRMGDKP